MPLLPATASASHNNGNAGLLVDGDYDNQWSSNTAQTSGMWVQFDLGAQVDIVGLAMHCVAGSFFSTDYPRSWNIHGSTTGSFSGEQTLLTSGSASAAGVIEQMWTRTTVRYVRITLTSGVGNWWRMNEVELFGPLPVATITSPDNLSIHGIGAPVSFAGSAVDPDDDPITGSDLVWTSDVDGEIGTGTSFSRSDLTTGNHVITLTATDSESRVGTAQIRIAVGEGSILRILVVTSQPSGTGTLATVALLDDNHLVDVVSDTNVADEVVDLDDYDVLVVGYPLLINAAALASVIEASGKPALFNMRDATFSSSSGLVVSMDLTDGFQAGGLNSSRNVTRLDPWSYHPITVERWNGGPAGFLSQHIDHITGIHDSADVVGVALGTTNASSGPAVRSFVAIEEGTPKLTSGSTAARYVLFANVILHNVTPGYEAVAAPIIENCLFWLAGVLDEVGPEPSSFSYARQFDEPEFGHLQSPPAGWSTRWNSTNLNHEVVQGDSFFPSGDAGVRMSNVSAAEIRRIIVNDEIGHKRDCDVYVRMRLGTPSTATQSIYVRARGVVSAETAYAVSEQPAGTVSLRYISHTNGVGEELASHGSSLAGGWYWFRVRVVDDLIQVKYWPSGDEEPDSWQIEENDSRLPFGYIGFGFRGTGSTTNWSYFDQINMTDPSFVPTVPGEPVIIAQTTSPTAITVTHSTPGSDADDHALYASGDPADLELPIDPGFLLADEMGPTPAPVVDSGLATGVARYYRSIATNDVGETESAIVSAVPGTAPVLHTAVALGSTRAWLEWTAAEGADAHELHRAPGSSAFAPNGSTLVDTFDENDGFHEDTGLTESETYTYVVVATFDESAPALSNFRTITTPPLGVNPLATKPWVPVPSVYQRRPLGPPLA